MEGTQTQPGWYQDPNGPGQRYWDGSQWTDQTSAEQGVAAQGGDVAQPGHAQSAGRSGKATASLVLGIIGIFILPIIFSLLAIIFGAMARKEIDENPGLEGRGLATAGLVLGIVGLVLGILILAILLA